MAADRCPTCSRGPMRQIGEDDWYCARCGTDWGGIKLQFGRLGVAIADGLRASCATLKTGGEG